MDLSTHLTFADMIQIIGIIIIPLVLFGFTYFSTSSITKKIIYKSKNKKYQAMCFRIISYICLIVALALMEYGFFVLKKHEGNRTELLAGIIMIVLILVLFVVYIKRNDTYKVIDFPYYKDSIAILVFMTIIGETVLLSLGMGLLNIMLYKSFVNIEVIPFMVSLILYSWSLGFSFCSELIIVNNAYGIDTIIIRTKTNSQKYSITSEICEKNEIISFSYEDGSESKYIVIPMHDIVKIEYIMGDKQLIRNIRRKKLQERKMTKDNKRRRKIR